MTLKGNILGSARAETDAAMLGQAFLETADYAALVNTQDFSFVVGRRGTGKSALFTMVQMQFRHIEDQLRKRMDTFVRSYLSLRHAERFRKKRSR